MGQNVDTELEALLDGKVPWSRVQEIMHEPRDPSRFDKVVEILQRRVAFADPIVLPLTLALFIVRSDHGFVVKCRCGQELGDYRTNWKLFTNVYVRDSQEALDEVYPGLQRLNPELVQVREYYCPGCYTQLEVETFTRGMPSDFELLPDLEAFYRDWLGRPLADAPAFEDTTAKELNGWT